MQNQGYPLMRKCLQMIHRKRTRRHSAVGVSEDYEPVNYSVSVMMVCYKLKMLKAQSATCANWKDTQLRRTVFSGWIPPI